MKRGWYGFVLGLLWVAILALCPLCMDVIIITVVNHDSLAVDDLGVLLGLLWFLLNKAKHIPPDVLRDIANFATQFVHDQSGHARGAVLAFLAEGLARQRGFLRRAAQSYCCGGGRHCRGHCSGSWVEWVERMEGRGHWEGEVSEGEGVGIPGRPVAERFRGGRAPRQTPPVSRPTRDAETSASDFACPLHTCIQ